MAKTASRYPAPLSDLLRASASRLTCTAYDIELYAVARFLLEYEIADCTETDRDKIARYCRSFDWKYLNPILKPLAEAEPPETK